MHRRAIEMWRSLIVGAAVLVLAACGQEATTPTVSEEAFELGADNVLFYMTSQLTEEGVRTAELNADTVYSFEDSRRLDMLGVRVVFYREDGSEGGVLTSRTADYIVADNLFIAREDVVLVTPGPNGDRRLETQELHYDLAGDKLWTDSPFVVYEEGRVTRGTRFTTDSNFVTWEVSGLQTEGDVEAGGGLTF